MGFVDTFRRKNNPDLRNIGQPIDQVSPDVSLYLPLGNLPGAVFRSFSKDAQQVVVTGAVFKRGEGWLLDGVDDFIQVAASSSLDFGTSDFSIMLWAKAQMNDAQPIICKGIADYSSITEGWAVNTNYWSTTDNMYFSHTELANRVTWSSATGADLKPFWTENKWHHWAWVGDRALGTISVYRDGQFVASRTPGNFGAFIQSLSSPLLIGKEGDAGPVYYLPATVGDVLILRRRLARHDVMALYASSAWRHLS